MTILHHPKPYRINEIPLEDWSVMTILPSKKGNAVVIDTPELKDICIDSIGSLYEVIRTHKLWYTYACPALFNSLLQGLTMWEAEELLDNRKVKGESVFKVRGQSRPHLAYKQYSIGLSADRITLKKVKCGEGQTYYIQNFATGLREDGTGWNVSNEPTVEELTAEVKILMEFFKQWGMDLTTGVAARARQFFQDIVGVEEIYKVRTLPPDLLIQFQASCMGCTRGEVIFSGSLEDTEAFDATAAHLEYLADCPGLIGSVVVSHKKPYYNPEADYGVYDGKAYIPSDISELGPLPVLVDIMNVGPSPSTFQPDLASLVYPVGGWYPFSNLPKPRADLLFYLTKYGVQVQFTDSIQIFCLKPKYYPYKLYETI